MLKREQSVAVMPELLELIKSSCDRFPSQYGSFKKYIGEFEKYIRNNDAN